MEKDLREKVAEMFITCSDGSKVMVGYDVADKVVALLSVPVEAKESKGGEGYPELSHFLQEVSGKGRQMLSIIEKEDMVFDGKGGKMEKMAFTLYSEIVGMGMKAQLLIEDDTLLAHNSIIAEKEAELEACRDANVQKKKEIAELKIEMNSEHNTSEAELQAKDSEIARLKAIIAQDYTAGRMTELETEIARLRKALEELAKLGNGDEYGNSIGNVIAQRALKEGE